ncbi:MAG: ferrous iron transport protein B [Bacteroidales bacterium]|nr:ferrous iron transport protein B [Bacteroidales bacterium]
MSNIPISSEKSARLDAVLTHKLWGFPIFLGVLWVMFQATFVIGQIPMSWIDEGVHAFSHWLQVTVADGWFKSLLIDGIVAGVGGVVIFLPNILILFTFISFMEDTGYMARVAVIMDKLMHIIGLHGKSFVPLIMGFGCNVPAIMATKFIENRRDRLLTMLIIPFMSCSARLPVYVLIAGAFFPNNAGTMIFCIYLFGILISMLTAIVLSRTVFKTPFDDSAITLTPYRRPSLHLMWQTIRMNTGEYLKKIGGIILIGSTIVWGLGYFPHHPEALPKQQLEESYLGRIGRTIEPALTPIGFDWRMGVAALAGISGKELIVSTMSVLYLDENTGQDEKTLNERFVNDPHLQPLNALSFLVFVLLYFPCIAVFSTIKNESGKWRYATLLALYTTTLAWVIAFAVFQLGGIFGL